MWSGGWVTTCFDRHPGERGWKHDPTFYSCWI